MTKTEGNSANVCDVSTNQVNRINELIEELIDLKKKVTKRKENRYNWESDARVLSVSIWAGEIKCQVLRKKEADLRIAVSEALKTIEVKELDLKRLIQQRVTFLSDQCDKFRKRNATYAEKILRAQKEYTNENLSRDINNYHEEYKKIYNELPTVTKKVETLKTLCDINVLSSCEKNEELATINNVLANVMKINNYTLHNITIDQDRLAKLEDEIKHKKMKLENPINK